MITIIGISGSLRRGSFNRMLLKAAAARAPEGTRIEVDDGLRAIPLFDEDLEAAGEPEAVALLRRRVRNASGVLIATPEYNQSLPGVLKNAIDWLSRSDEVLIGKPVAIVGASGGRWGTRLAQAALRQTLTATEALVMPKPAMYVRDAAQLFDVSGRLTDARAIADLDGVLAAFARWIAAASLLQTTS